MSRPRPAPATSRQAGANGSTISRCGERFHAGSLRERTPQWLALSEVSSVVRVSAPLRVLPVPGVPYTSQSNRIVPARTSEIGRVASD